jgi:hypothetical protein
MPPPHGFGTQPASKAARVTVVGHASMRWRGAKNTAEAARLNLALSNQRAENLRAFVVQILKREIPNVTIEQATSLVPGQHATGVQVGSYGVGSGQPVLNPAPPKINPQENNPVNRSVVVFIELITTHYGHADVSLTPLRIGARTQFWYGKVMAIEGGAVGAAGYFLTCYTQPAVAEGGDLRRVPLRRRRGPLDSQAA